MSQIGKIHRDLKLDTLCLVQQKECKKGIEGIDCQWHQSLFQRWWNYFEIDLGDGCTTPEYVKTTELCFNGKII